MRSALWLWDSTFIRPALSSTVKLLCDTALRYPVSSIDNARRYRNTATHDIASNRLSIPALPDAALSCGFLQKGNLS